MANENAFYKAVLNFKYAGQAIVNVLYYKLASEFIPGPLNFAGASDLAFQIKQEVWTPGYKPSMPNDCFLENITVYPYDEAFNLIFQLPYVLAVNEAGPLAATVTNGPAPCAIIRFNLEPTSPLNGIYPPRGGYIAFGPLLDGSVDNGGRLTAGALSGMQAIANKLSSNLTNAVPPAIFHPVRVKTTNVLGVIKIRSYADIESAIVRSVVSFRRSRKPE